VLREHFGTLALATGSAITVFVIFYLMTVFMLSWGTTELGFARQEFLVYQMIGVLFFAATIPVSAVLADRVGRIPTLIATTAAILAFGLVFGSFFAVHDAARIISGLSLGLACMGLTYGPLGTALTELFPTAVRYTGVSIAFNVAGILGGSVAPYIATWLAKSYGIAAVGYYLSVAAAITLGAAVAIQSRERARSVATAAETLPGTL
jgi:MFS family permease